MAEIGTTLREARTRAGITIDEVEMRTKIRAKYLRAIEGEQWDLLPGPVYAKSFLRTYGDFLGLDSRMLVDEFRRRYERPSDQEARPASSLVRERERQARGPLLPPWAVIGLVLVAVVVVLYVLGSRSGPSTPSTTTTGAGNAKARHRHRARRRRAPPVSGTVKLQLVPTGTVYVCLVNEKGVKLLDERTFSAGQSVATETGSKLLLTLGNNSARVVVNGRTVPIAASATAIRLMITPSGVSHIPMTTPPTCP